MKEERKRTRGCSQAADDLPHCSIRTSAHIERQPHPQRGERRGEEEQVGWGREAASSSSSLIRHKGSGLNEAQWERLDYAIYKLRMPPRLVVSGCRKSDYNRAAGFIIPPQRIEHKPPERDLSDKRTSTRKEQTSCPSTIKYLSGHHLIPRAKSNDVQFINIPAWLQKPEPLQNTACCSHKYAKSWKSW